MMNIIHIEFIRDTFIESINKHMGHVSQNDDSYTDIFDKI